MRASSRLYVQVLIGVAIGIALGYAEPQLAISVKPFGDAFIKAIKLMVAPIVFVTVVVGIATMGDIRRVASVGLKAIIYFEITSTLALIVGLVAGNVWPVGAGINVDPKTFDASMVASYVNQAKSLTISDFLLNIIPTTFVDPFVKAKFSRYCSSQFCSVSHCVKSGIGQSRLSASSIRSQKRYSPWFG